MAQLVEQLIRNQQVVGSSPISSSKNSRNHLISAVFAYMSGWAVGKQAEIVAAHVLTNAGISLI